MFRRKSNNRRAPISTMTNLFHGIAVEPGDGACQAVRSIEGHRYLSDDAPRLPLDGCQCVQDCHCVYRHYSDRRTEVRRDADMGLPRRDVPRDQREGVGRRITDA